MEEHRNLEKFVEKKLYVCKKKYIDIPKDEGQRYGKHFKALKSKIFGILRKESAQLDTLIAAYSLEGSVGDRLKIAKPNEFDLVFKLEFPYYKSIAVTRDPKIPGNVLLDMTRVLELLKDDPREDFQRIRELIQGRLVDAQNFLVVDRLRSWLQSLFSQALNRISDRVELVPGAVSHLKYRTCGPAHTIYVYGDYEYSVDFVPAIRLAAEQNVLPTKQLEYLNTSYWEAIPKPLKILTETSTISFRSSFYALEKLMLQGVHENCRNAIRFMKKFRDEPNSYWQNPLSFILPDMFHDLAEHLRRGVIPFFWDPELNMLDALTRKQVWEMYLCVRRIPKMLWAAGISRNKLSLFVLRAFSAVHSHQEYTEVIMSGYTDLTKLETSR
ncbi:GD24904 [Drosophila simulans]|uniref:GD24904 n=1 Tax=Drosophila simulans TaxID=7240 RepID=B4QD50_DROSI|nr:GD24904 [Drosophila simulans]